MHWLRQRPHNDFRPPLIACELPPKTRLRDDDLLRAVGMPLALQQAPKSHLALRCHSGASVAQTGLH